jgi:L-seryl-tRNA(Ser) seleniumtransferase
MATKSSRAWSRRELLESGGLIAGATLAGGASAAARPHVEPELRIGKDIYSSIGVKPVINCRGTFTILSGSTSLPEVKRAMDEASRHYVNLDEHGRCRAPARNTKGVGHRDRRLFRGRNPGCACGGTSPENATHSDLVGMKNEVVIPRYSRNV